MKITFTKEIINEAMENGCTTVHELKVYMSGNK